MELLLGSVKTAHFSAVSNGSAPHKSWLLPWGQSGMGNVVMPLNEGGSSLGAVCTLGTNVRLAARPEVA